MEFVIIWIISVLFIWIIWIYNTIIKYKNYVDNAYRLIDVNLQKRSDLIPNLVKTVQAYKDFEKEVLEDITKLRSQVVNQNTIDKNRQEKEQCIWTDLKKIFAVSEDYPNLKSNENFLKLQKEISRVEENLAAAREIYNSNLKILNTTMQIFPYNLVAQRMKIPEYEYFEANVTSQD